MRADLTDGVVLRRRLSSWRLVVSVAVTVAAAAAALWIALDSGDRWHEREQVIAAASTGVCAVAGATLSLFEWRRLRRSFQRALQRVALAEAELQTLLEDLPDAVLTIDDDGLVRGASAQVGELVGIDAGQLIGAPALRLVAVADRGTFAGWLADGRLGEARPLTVSLSELAPPELRRQRLELTYERPRSPASSDAIVRMRDVTEHERNTKALGLARRRFQQAFHSAPTGMALVRLDNASIVDANRSLALMLDEPVDSLLGRSIIDLTHPDDIEIARMHANRLERGLTDSYHLDQRYRHRDGHYVWTRTRVAVTEGEGVPLAITHIEDVSEQRRIAEQLQWAATHDDLTGLPNRTELLARVDQRLREAPVASLTMLFIDLDNFKTVNDSLGHAIGDMLLTELAERLRATVGREALLGRFGGDEFIVVVSRPTDAGAELFDPAFIAEQLRDTVRSAVDVHGTELFVTASIGYSLNHRPGMTAAELLRDADAAMYRAKERGRDCVEAYSPDGHETTVLALRTANELRRGLARGEVVAYYQPIVTLESGLIVGFEALARWLHPERGLLTPDQFLPLAEETGLVGEIGALILRDGLSQLARWRERHVSFGDAYLSVNVGTRQIVDAGFAEFVAGLLAETGVPADSLWLELTETALLADVKASSVALRNLRSLGVHLAVDDFGTGYSSLTYLKRFPVETIKIDRSFVAGLGLDQDDSTIVEAVVRLGHAFGMSVVAEGLETPLQLARLRELGCDRGQGYLFGRPRPAALLEHDHAAGGGDGPLPGGSTIGRALPSR